MNPIILGVCGLALFVGGIVVGRKYEQQAVAKVLADFAKVDAAAKSLVNRCYTYLSDGVKAELKKLAAL